MPSRQASSAFEERASFFFSDTYIIFGCHQHKNGKRDPVCKEWNPEEVNIEGTARTPELSPVEP